MFTKREELWQNFEIDMRILFRKKLIYVNPYRDRIVNQQR